MMIDVPITQQQLDNWLSDLNLVAEISSSKAMLLAWNAAGELSCMLSSDSAAESEIQAILSHLSGNPQPAISQSVVMPSMLTPSEIVSNPFDIIDKSTIPPLNNAKLSSLSEPISALPRLGSHQITAALSVSQLTEQVREPLLIMDTRQHSDWHTCSAIGSVICLSLAWPSGAHFGFLCFYHNEAHGVDRSIKSQNEIGRAHV
jgi:hypothetical protein